MNPLAQFLHYGQKVFALKLLLRGVRDRRPQPQIKTLPVLRHAFCTYRVAATQDVPRTALEAGNSASTIFAHYRALATEAEGKAWFAIMPS